MQQKVLDSRYELDRKIAEGGMARVYIGRDLRLNRRVAIKIPHSHFLSDPDFLERFRHEAQAAAMLNHPNIVDVYDVGKDGDINYIVMEFVEGMDLKALIKREGPLPTARAVALAEQIARALGAAHRANMIHRDIKPQNVIVTPDGQARITDFGIAKSQLSTAQTETGISLGTVDYLSPEQAQGRPALPQSDIYSLGVVLYEMLTGRLPFTGDNAVAVAMKHLHEAPRPPRQLNPQIPVGLEALVLRAMAKDPAQRPANAAEFAQLLAGYDRIAHQETMINPALGANPVAQPQRPATPQPQPQRPATPQPQPQRPATPQPQRPAAKPTGNTGRVAIPPPPAAPARVPRQEGLGCGVFVVGMFLLVGVLGLVFLFSTGALNGIFAGTGSSNRPTPEPMSSSPSVATAEPSPTSDTRVAVPSLTGLSDQAAQEALRNAQLTPQRREVSRADVQAGLVVGQEVAPNTLLAPGSPVTYTVSLGPQLVEVPDVRNTPATLAQSSLRAQGFDVELREQPSANVDAGFVISQAPSPGLRVPAGERVQLVISQGDVVRFPDIIGLDVTEAQRIIEGTAGVTLVFIDFQGRDRLGNFDAYRPNELVSAQIENGKGLNNGEMIPRNSRIIFGVRAP